MKERIQEEIEREIAFNDLTEKWKDDPEFAEEQAQGADQIIKRLEWHQNKFEPEELDRYLGHLIPQRDRVWGKQEK